MTEIKTTTKVITRGAHKFIHIRRCADDLYDTSPTAKLNTQIMISHMCRDLKIGVVSKYSTFRTLYAIGEAQPS